MFHESAPLQNQVCTVSGLQVTAQEQKEPQKELCQHLQTPPKDLAAQPRRFSMKVKRIKQKNYGTERLKYLIKDNNNSTCVRAPGCHRNSPGTSVQT